MALKSITSITTFREGDVVVHSSHGDTYGVKILKEVYVAETDSYHFIAAGVAIKDNKPNLGSDVSLTAHTATKLRNYSYKWTPDEEFKSGDVLEDQDGVLFLFVSKDRVWNLSKGTHTTLERWTTTGSSYGGRKFKSKKTAGDQKFSSVMEIKNLM